jgi:hypothetical protein
MDAPVINTEPNTGASPWRIAESVIRNRAVPPRKIDVPQSHDRMPAPAGPNLPGETVGQANARLAAAGTTLEGVGR